MVQGDGEQAIAAQGKEATNYSGDVTLGCLISQYVPKRKLDDIDATHVSETQLSTRFSYIGGGNFEITCNLWLRMILSKRQMIVCATSSVVALGFVSQSLFSLLTRYLPDDLGELFLVLLRNI